MSPLQGSVLSGEVFICYNPGTLSGLVEGSNINSEKLSECENCS